jgi:hypothetical protein
MLPRWGEVVELLKKGMTLEAQQKLVELQEAFLTLKEDNLALRQQVSDLNAKLAGKSDMVWYEPFYWRERAEDFDGPYCQLCFDKDQKRIRLSRSEVQDVPGGTIYSCGCCEKTWIGKGWPNPPSRG